MAFARQFMAMHGYSPSVPVISKTIGLGLTATNRYLNLLEDAEEIHKRGKSIEILIDPPVSAAIRDEKGSAILDVSGPKIIYGDNIRQPRATAPQLGSLLATFEKMRDRA